jgi:hypothetical protein
MSGIGKKKIAKLGCEKYFCKDHILSSAGDALTPADERESQVCSVSASVIWFVGCSLSELGNHC